MFESLIPMLGRATVCGAAIVCALLTGCSGTSPTDPLPIPSDASPFEPLPEWATDPGDAPDAEPIELPTLRYAVGLQSRRTSVRATEIQEIATDGTVQRRIGFWQRQRILATTDRVDDEGRITDARVQIEEMTRERLGTDRETSRESLDFAPTFDVALSTGRARITPIEPPTMSEDSKRAMEALVGDVVRASAASRALAGRPMTVGEPLAVSPESVAALMNVPEDWTVRSHKARVGRQATIDGTPCIAIRWEIEVELPVSARRSGELAGEGAVAFAVATGRLVAAEFRFSGTMVDRQAGTPNDPTVDPIAARVSVRHQYEGPAN